MVAKRTKAMRSAQDAEASIHEYLNALLLRTQARIVGTDKDNILKVDITKSLDASYNNQLVVSHDKKPVFGIAIWKVGEAEIKGKKPGDVLEGGSKFVIYIDEDGSDYGGNPVGVLGGKDMGLLMSQREEMHNAVTRLLVRYGLAQPGSADKVMPVELDVRRRGAYNQPDDPGKDWWLDVKLPTNRLQ